MRLAAWAVAVVGRGGIGIIPGGCLVEDGLASALGLRTSAQGIRGNCIYGLHPNLQGKIEINLYRLDCKPVNNNHLPAGGELPGW
jgi:hypothetical protein